jgi:mycothiol synthase
VSFPTSIGSRTRSMSSSPPELRARPVRLGDAEAVRELIAAFAERHAEGTDVVTDDRRDEWRRIDLERDSWIWEHDGAIAAYAALLAREERVDADGYVHPDRTGLGFGSLIVEATETRARDRGLTRLHNAVMASDRSAASLLEQRGYRDIRHFYRMAIGMEAPPPESSWPDGLEPRAVDRDGVRAFHEASEEAFEDEWDYQPQPFERFEEFRVNVPTFDPSLWTAVWDGDEIAGTLRADRNRFGAGWIGSVGVRRPWRRRGLGLALLQRSFGQFWERGERRVQLGVDAQNPTGATRLYERAGMYVVWEAVIFEKELVP